jgi:uncharacterized protein (DUF1778 family)
MELVEEKQEARIEVRCSPSDKGIIEEAASVLGVNLSAFIKSHLVKAAREVLRLSQITPLSEKDGKLFFELIEADSSPTDALIKGAQRYRANGVHDEG